MPDESPPFDYATLAAEHEALRSEHADLKQRPDDLAAHRRHSQRLAQHVDRLHAYRAARGVGGADRPEVPSAMPVKRQRSDVDRDSDERHLSQSEQRVRESKVAITASRDSVLHILEHTIADGGDRR